MCFLLGCVLSDGDALRAVGGGLVFLRFLATIRFVIVSWLYNLTVSRAIVHLFAKEKESRGYGANDFFFFQKESSTGASRKNH